MTNEITEIQILNQIDDCHDNVLALTDLLALVTYSAGEVRASTFTRLSSIIETKIKSASKLVENLYAIKK